MALFGKKPEAPATAASANVPVSQVLAMRSQGMNNTQIANNLRATGFSLTQIKDAFTQADIKSTVGGGATGAPVASGEDDLAALEREIMGNSPSGEQPLPEGMGELEMPDLPGIPENPLSGPAPQQFAPMPQQQFSQPQSQPVAPAPMRPPAKSMESTITEVQRVIEEIIEEKWDEVEDKLNALDVWKAKIEEQVDGVSSKMKEMTGRLDGFAQGMAKKTDEYQSTIEESTTQMEAIEKLMGKLIPSLADEIKELRNVVDKMKKH